MKENKIQFFYIDIMALGSKSPTGVIEQKLQYALLNATGCPNRSKNLRTWDVNKSYQYYT